MAISQAALKARQAAADRAFKETMSGLDKFITLGFKKKGILRLISIHIGRRKSKNKNALSSAGLRALTGK
jgi:hypothetical protein